MNNSFDRCFKDFVDAAPELFLTLLGMLPLAPGWELRILRAETSPPVLLPDFVGLASGPNGERVILHVEFYPDYANWQPSKMARYGGNLMGQHDCEVWSWMVLIRPGAPEHIPGVGAHGSKRTTVTHRFETVKLWEVSAAPILENESMRHLFSLVPALACDWEDVLRVTAAVRDSGDEKALSQLMLMLSFKYDRSKIEELIGRPKMGFGEVLWEGSSLLKEMRENAINSGRAEGLAQGVEEGRAKGIEQGLEQGIEQGVQQGIQQGMQQGIVKGQAEEARRLLRAVLADRFPGTETILEIDHIAEVSALESLLVDKVLKLAHRTDVERAICQAAAR